MIYSVIMFLTDMPLILQNLLPNIKKGDFMIVTAIVFFIISAVSFVICIRSFMEKGFLLNNAYIYASEQEREAMNKKPYYRQSGIVFLLIGLIFLLNGFNLIFDTDWIFYVIIAIMAVMFIYAIVSSIRIEKNNKNI